MALTVTRSGDWQSVYGHWRKSHVTVAFDSSYPTGGESLTPADFGLRVIDMILIEPKNGFEFEYDYTNSLVKVFKAQSQGVINVDTSNTQNVGTGEDDLTTYTLPAGVLGTNGMGVRVTNWGTTTNNSNQKVIRGYFGSASTGMAFFQASLAGSWKAVMEVVRTGAATQDTNILITGASTVSGSLGTHNAVVVTTSNITETLSGTNVIKLTGTATTTGDIIQSGQIVEVFAPNASGGTGIEVPNATDLSSLTSVRCIAWGY